MSRWTTDANKARFASFLRPSNKLTPSPPLRARFPEVSRAIPPLRCYSVVVPRKEKGIFTVETTEPLAFLRMFNAPLRSESSL